MTDTNRIDDLIRVNSKNLKLVSIDPTHSIIDCYWGDVDWVIIGAETDNRRGKIVPKRNWITSIVKNAGSSGVSIFIKDNVNWPDALRKFPSS